MTTGLTLTAIGEGMLRELARALPTHPHEGARWAGEQIQRILDTETTAARDALPESAS